MSEIKFSYRNRNWTPERIKLLRRMYATGYRLDAIADAMHEGCTIGALKRKIELLGLPPREQYSTWTEELEAFLRDRWDEGHSALKISQMIGTQFNLPITRNAVIGKARRLNLASRAQGFTPAVIKANREAARIRKDARLRRLPSKPQRAPLAAIVPVPLPAPTQEPDRASWVNLEDLRGCAWVYGDPLGDHGYCGCETVPGKSYCLGHLQRVYIQLDVRRRKKDWDEETKQKIKALQELINS
jgi:GcrA cell cycle regulator